MTRGQCGSLHLHCKRLALSTPCRSSRRTEIVAFDLTDKEVDDALHVAPLLDQLAGAPASFMGDGAYDRTFVFEGVLARNPNAKFIVPPRKGAVTGPTVATSPTQRDQHVLAVDAHGRMNWQKTSGSYAGIWVMTA